MELSKEQRIGEAALKLFYRHGYGKVTMLDIAEAAEMSRPTLYAAFENKEAILASLLDTHAQQYEAEAIKQSARKKSLRERLSTVFDVWIVMPFASVVDSENGQDLLTNCATYAEAATARLYMKFEWQLAAVLKPEMARKRAMTANDLAHILATAARGLKATTTSLVDMQRMVDGLITMAIATVGKK